MGSKRSLVSYDDITLPYEANWTLQSQSRASKPPPSKKRKGNKLKARRYGVPAQTDGFAIDCAVTSSSNQLEAEDENKYDDVESRELTYDEIWDDSALIEAWNAASEEYEAYNGPDKGWKMEPVHQSPLWYNVPPAPSKSVGNPTAPTIIEDGPRSSMRDPETDSQPFNFDTFVPSHDPSPNLPDIPELHNVSHYLSEPQEHMVSQDEAFTRALGAMYWSGYWTAMYHSQRRGRVQTIDARLQGEEEREETENENENEDEEFVSTQR